MKTQQAFDMLQDRIAPIEISSDDFRAAGHNLVDAIADFLNSLPERPVGPGETPAEVRRVLGNAPLPEEGTSPHELLEETANLMFKHSLFNGHPRFWGYITSSAAPIGALADLLASAVNPNVGAWLLSPMASEIEAQTIKWMYSALEAGCILVRNPEALIDTLSYHPTYYKFEEAIEEAPINFY